MSEVWVAEIEISGKARVYCDNFDCDLIKQTNFLVWNYDGDGKQILFARTKAKAELELTKIIEERIKILNSQSKPEFQEIEQIVVDYFKKFIINDWFLSVFEDQLIQENSLEDYQINQLEKALPKILKNISKEIK